MKIGIVDMNFWSSAVFNAVRSSGVTPDQLAIVLSFNVGLVEGNSCCTFGLPHTRPQTLPATAQSWIWASWLPPGIFGGFEDVTGLSHEVSEWLNDPVPGAPLGTFRESTCCAVCASGTGWRVQSPLRNGRRSGSSSERRLHDAGNERLHIPPSGCSISVVFPSHHTVARNQRPLHVERNLYIARHALRPRLIVNRRI